MAAPGLDTNLVPLESGNVKEVGKGVLLLVPHTGSGEICARWLTANLPVVRAVTRRQKPDWVARIVQERRAEIGPREIDNKNAIRNNQRHAPSPF